MKKIDRDLINRPLQHVWNGAVVLTLAALISKILSAGYRIPYHYIAGDIGFYIYQQIYPFYGLAVLFSTYGFPVIISKLVAEEISRGKKDAVDHIIKVSFLTLFLFNLLLFLLQYIGAERIAALMGDPKLANLIRVVSFAFLLTPFIAVLRGCYQGLNDMVPTAVSQVAEQIVRVATILIFSYLLLKNGYGVYEAGAGALFGSITGGFAALAILLLFFLKNGGKLWRRKSMKKGRDYTKKIISTLFVQGTLACVSGMGILFIQFIDSFTLYSQLVEGGLDKEAAKTIKGIYDRGLPLIQLGTVVGTAFSLSLVPVISAAVLKKDECVLREKTELSIRLSFVIGAGAVLGLIGIMQSANILLYGDAAGTDMLRIFCVTILFTTITATTAAILQGMGHARASALTMVIGMMVKWGLNIWLIPLWGTTGAAVSSVASFAFVAGINGFYLYKELRFPVVRRKVLQVTCKAGLTMLLLLFVYTHTMHWMTPASSGRSLQTVWEALSSVVVGGIIYIWLILRNGLFTHQEVLNIPYGDKLSKWIKP
ncbi:PST family polysaccharide transporter [Bacillus fengqiuensis]|nr:PST family polysaccharide transporter [Bacillus fengqiuensis]